MSILIRVAFILLFCGSAYTLATLPNQVDSSIKATEKNRLQREIRDAYNSTAKY